MLLACTCLGKRVLYGRGRNLYVSCVAGLIEVMKLYAFLESALL